ncbi:MAG: aminotransferase class IV, partial [Fusobacteriaceae bacterium]
MEIKVIKAETLKAKPDSNNLGFGKYFTDYMFQMDYTEDKGWHNFEILPYAPISLSPTAFVLHYGQEVFEGLKAYRSKEGKILLFRPDRNAKRLQTSCQRLCMATVPQEMFLEAVETLVRHEKEWVPHGDETSLYIRPFLFATESGVGVHPSNSYKFIIVLSPVGAYY